MSIISEFPFTQPDGFTFGEMINARGQKIRTGHIDAHNARGTILLLTGLSEFTEKYYETIRNLVTRGFSVRTFDWISQGGSERIIPDQPYKIHVTDFAFYLDDLKQFISQHLSDTSFYIMAHSMGGHLTLRYLTDNYDHSNVIGTILSAPMMNIKTLTGIMGHVVKWPMFQARLERDVTSYTINAKDWAADTYRASDKFKYSSDPVRDRLQNEFLLAHENLRVGGQTNGWLLAALNSLETMTKNLVGTGLQTPTVVCLPTDDFIISTPDSKNLLANTPGEELHVVEFIGAKHEILMECNKFRNAFLQNFDQLVAKRPQFGL